MIRCNIPEETVLSTQDAVNMIGDRFMVTSVESVGGEVSLVLSRITTHEAEPDACPTCLGTKRIFNTQLQIWTGCLTCAEQA